MARIDLDLADRTLMRERHRFESYLRAFEKTGSPHLEGARVLLEAVRDFEEELVTHHRHEFVVVHGDYHPKNIIIGQGMMQDMGTMYVSVIDFGSVLAFHPAFDVGYFLAQFSNHLRDYPDAIERYPGEDFIQAYLSASNRPDTPSFRRATELFQVRANLSIASFLIHVGKRMSANMEEVMTRSRSILKRAG